MPLERDDPLLSALTALCKVMHVPKSPDALIAGLPLDNNYLTAEYFPRAAERADLSAGLVRRPLEKISNLILPAVLLLKENQACVLLGREGNNFKIMVPESREGQKLVTLEELEKDYIGQAFFVQKTYKFDREASSKVSLRFKHWFWDVIFKSWPLYVEVLVASLFINIFALASSLFIMNVYDRVVPNRAIETLWVMAIGVAIIFIFDFILRALRGYFIDAASKKADIILSANIFEKIMGIRMESRPASVGELASHVQEFESLRDFITSASIIALVDLPFLFIFIAVIWLLGGDLAYIPLAVIPIVIIGPLIIQVPMNNIINKLFKYSTKRSGILFESINNLETLKTLNAEGQVQREWEANNEEISKLKMKSKMYSSIMMFFTDYLIKMTTIAVIVYGVYKIAENELSMGALIACTILTGRAMAPVTQVTSLILRYKQAMKSMQSINHLMSLPVEREHEANFLHRNQLLGNIEFKNVSFTYPDQEMQALKNVSFRIKAGEHVGIIGRIGAGKSTIEKLILGLYKAQEGVVTIDEGINVQQIDPTVLRREIGYVPQDVTLFSGSLKDNIVMGSRYADDDAAIRAADLAGVTVFANRHPAGFDLQVGEKGGFLSGGQRQSVVLARALLLDPDIYIMDEPTNSMDNSTEESFKRRFAEILENKTLILITQKGSLLSLVDRLIVMENQTVVADGPKEQVMEALKKGRIRV